MSDRVTREPMLAGRQFQQDAVSQLRLLRARANRGAIRTLGAPEFTPSTLTDYVLALSMPILPGRWTVTGEATFVATPTVSVAFRLTLNMTDPSSGEELVSDLFDFPTRKFDMTKTNLVRQSLTVTGDFVGTTIANINLMCFDESENSYTLEEPRLLLMPW